MDRDAKARRGDLPIAFTSLVAARRRRRRGRLGALSRLASWRRRDRRRHVVINATTDIEVGRRRSRDTPSCGGCTAKCRCSCESSTSRGPMLLLAMVNGAAGSARRRPLHVPLEVGPGLGCRGRLGRRGDGSTRPAGRAIGAVGRSHRRTTARRSTGVRSRRSVWWAAITASTCDCRRRARRRWRCAKACRSVAAASHRAVRAPRAGHDRRRRGARSRDGVRTRSLDGPWCARQLAKPLDRGADRYRSTGSIRRHRGPVRERVGTSVAELCAVDIASLMHRTLLE